MEIEDFIEIIDPRIIGEIKQDFLKKYSFLIPKEILSQNATTIEVIVLPDEEFKLLNMPDEDRLKIQYWRKFEVIWYYKTGKIILPIGQKNAFLKFDFWGVGYINKTRPEFRTEIIDPVKYHLRKIQEMKLEIFKRYSLVDLWDYHDDYISPSTMGKFSHVTAISTSRYLYIDYHACNDFMFTSRDLKNILSELLLYRPYILDHTKDYILAGEEILYIYNPSFYDKNYYFLCSQFIQTLYSYWDKIALLLHAYFPVELRKDKVSFVQLIEVFPKEYKAEHYNWLLNYRNNKFSEINKKRKKIVHYQSLESQIYQEFFDGFNDEAKMNTLQSWKVKMVDDFIQYFNDSITGLKEALKLIESKNNTIS